jgi:hypothetical protein
MPLANSVSADRREISISWFSNAADPTALELFSANVHLFTIDIFPNLPILSRLVGPWRDSG